MKRLAPWWERWPGRLEHELQALDAAGISYEVDEGAWQEGRLVIHVWVEDRGVRRRMRAVFPDVYPYARFEIIADDLALPRHQHPFYKNLCILPDGQGYWRTTNTLAQFLAEQVPRVIAAGEDRALGAEIEDPQQEPFSRYFEYEEGSAVLVGGGCSLGNSTLGTLELHLTEGANQVLRGAVVTVRDDSNLVLAQLDNVWRDAFQGQVVHVPWRWLDHPPVLRTAEQVVQTFFGPNVSGARANVNGGSLQIYAIAFPEEQEYQHDPIGWVFCVAYRRTGRKASRRPRRPHWYFAQAMPASRCDFAQRLPLFDTMQQHTVVVAGLGCLGEPSVRQLAQSGVGQLRVVDYDVLEPGNTVRWTHGLPAVGWKKPRYVAAEVARNFPSTSVDWRDLRIGAAVPENGRYQDDELDSLLEDADLVYDATADPDVQRLLAEMAGAHGIPYVQVSATPGAWGGLVARLRPDDESGCWCCLQAHLDGCRSLIPPRDPHGSIRPTGCSSPSFVAAPFEVGEIVQTGVRMAVSELCDPDAYPSMPHDAVVLRLRGPNGEARLPEWQGFNVPIHPRCPSHSDQESHQPPAAAPVGTQNHLGSEQ